MAKGREIAVMQIIQRLEAGELDVDQMLRLVREWAPEDGNGVGAQVRVLPDGTVVLDLVPRPPTYTVEEWAQLCHPDPASK